MIKPVNNHILIEPIKYESFVSSGKDVYEEVGVITVTNPTWELAKIVPVGTKVFFDSYLAAKYPTGKGNDFFWLVNWNDVRAIEYEGEDAEEKLRNEKIPK